MVMVGAQRVAPGFSDNGSKVKIPIVEDKIYPAFVESLPTLKGKCIAITGTTSGTGYWCALATVKKEAAAVLLLNRKSERAVVADADVCAAAGDATKVFSVECDLSSFDSTAKAVAMVEEHARALGGLDVLCLNAGVIDLVDERTVDGYDVQMQINHLSHALLADKLMPSLEAAAEARGEARVVFHSSGARFMKRHLKDFGGKHFSKCAPGTLGGNSGSLSLMMLSSYQQRRYCHSKLANACYALALHERLQAASSKVKALCADPGAATTSLMTNGFQVNSERSINTTLANCFVGMFKGVGQSGGDGTCPLLEACFGPDANSGDLFTPCGHTWYIEFYVAGMPIKTIVGNRVKPGGTYFPETNALNKQNQEAAWKATQAAIRDYEPQ